MSDFLLTLSGFFCGAVAGFVVVGAFFYFQYVKMVAKIGTLQAELMAKGVSMAKDVAISTTSSVVKNFFTKKR